MGEAYLPILEALGRLCRTPCGEQLIPLLRQRAPTWLVQMPWLLRPEDRELLRQELQGTTRERMLREFAEVVDTLTVDAPLLLLEDLHWSAHATLDVLFLLARRRTPARLLLLGTYRPVETLGHGHPLRTVTHELRRPAMPRHAEARVRRARDFRGIRRRLRHTWRFPPPSCAVCPDRAAPRSAWLRAAPAGCCGALGTSPSPPVRGGCRRGALAARTCRLYFLSTKLKGPELTSRTLSRTERVRV
jgi:hypothetical protein